MSKLTRTKILKNIGIRKGYWMGSNLSGANLSGADLTDTNLSDANLNKADLREVYIAKADLCGADLSGANLSGANLMEADLTDANFSGANLSGADLSGADLSGADLSGANFSEANLREADLSGANLMEAKLTGSKLTSASFENANLKQADISGANIYHINTHGWKIDCIKCTHVYNYQHYAEDEAKAKSCRNFELGEFERIYKAIPTIEMIFNKELSELDFVKLRAIIKTINEENSESKLKIRGLEDNGFDWVVRLVTQKNEDLDEITKRIISLYKDRGLEKRLLPIVKQLGGLVESSGQQVVHHHYHYHGNIFTAPSKITTIEAGGKQTNVPFEGNLQGGDFCTFPPKGKIRECLEETVSQIYANF